MPAPCPYTVQIIGRNEYIGDSLEKINSNFTSLASAACNLEQYIEQKINVRTFFYYGPNSTYTPVNNPINPGDPTSGMDSGNPSRPSNSTIENFVSGSDGLNLLPISEINDQVYVIYQKTGWATTQEDYSKGGSGSIPYTVPVQVPVTRTIGIAGGRRGGKRTTYETRYVTRYSTYSWNINAEDINIDYSPGFVIYRLKHDGVDYKVDVIGGFPKYVTAKTADTINWNNPKLWNRY